MGANSLSRFAGGPFGDQRRSVWLRKMMRQRRRKIASNGLWSERWTAAAMGSELAANKPRINAVWRRLKALSTLKNARVSAWARCRKRKASMRASWGLQPAGCP